MTSTMLGASRPTGEAQRRAKGRDITAYFTPERWLPRCAKPFTQQEPFQKKMYFAPCFGLRLSRTVPALVRGMCQSKDCTGTTALLCNQHNSLSSRKYFNADATAAVIVWAQYLPVAAATASIRPVAALVSSSIWYSLGALAWRASDLPTYESRARSG